MSPTYGRSSLDQGYKRGICDLGIRTANGSRGYSVEGQPKSRNAKCTNAQDVRNIHIPMWKIPSSAAGVDTEEGSAEEESTEGSEGRSVTVTVTTARSG